MGNSQNPGQRRVQIHVRVFKFILLSGGKTANKQNIVRTMFAVPVSSFLNLWARQLLFKAPVVTFCDGCLCIRRDPLKCRRHAIFKTEKFVCDRILYPEALRLTRVLF